MAKAIWNGAIIAEAPIEQTERVEGNIYFPLSAVNRDYLRASEHHTLCPWKGTASYYHLEVDGKRNENAAWFYPDPSAKAAQIEGHVAFWKGVQVES